MSYRQNAASNRDALFGGAVGGGGSSRGGGSKRNNNAKPSSRPITTSSRPSATPSSTNTARGYSYGARSSSSTTTKKPTRPALSGDARAAKLKEAEEHRKQAKKCMARGVFSKPDPVTASMYYKRAADAYQQCGEDRLEKIHRVACADCQVSQGAYATAAAEYTRAAEIVQNSTTESIEEKRKEGSILLGQAADAFLQLGDAGKAGKAMVQSAVAWTWEDDSGVLEKRALTSMEEAVETFVPDVLNRYARYRQTGSSNFVDPNSTEQPDLELAKQHMVTSSYAHEPLLDMCYILIQHREFPSALYAAGAAAAILESDGISTLTLGRVYAVETIVLLAMGDPVAAEQAFLNTHVQQTSYLTSRECRLSEDLFRAILQRDPDALDEARSPEGPNRAAMANLHESTRTLVTQLRISGAARKSVPKAKVAAAPAVAAPAPVPAATDELFATSNPETEAPPKAAAPHPEEQDIDALHSEMDDLMNDMGLGSDSEEELDDDDDDEFDLR